MGYYICQDDCDFTIKEENIQKAWDALIKVFKKEEKSILYSTERHYSWIDTDTVINANSFEEAMDECRWSVCINSETGDVFDICFNGEKYGDEDIILGAIAPYVENGSYITMRGEEGERWKWKFIDGYMEEINGSWHWDDEE